MSAHTGSDRARRAAIRLLRWYPRPWRMRYEREMLALLDDIPVGWRQVGNIAGTAVREWLSPRALGWPARSAAGRLQTVRTLTFLIYAFTLDGIARIVAARLIAADFTISDALDTWIASLMFAPTVRVLTASVFKMKRVQRSRWAGTINRHRWLQFLSDWEVVAWLLLFMPFMVLRHAEPRPSYATDTMWALRPYMDIYLVWMFTNLLVQRTSLYVRIRRVQFAFMNRPKVWPARTPGYWP